MLQRKIKLLLKIYIPRILQSLIPAEIFQQIYEWTFGLGSQHTELTGLFGSPAQQQSNE